MYTVYCNQCTLHCKQCTLHCKRCTVYCVLCSVYTVYARSVWVCVHMFWLELSAYRHVMPTAPSFCTIINKQVTEACTNLQCEKCAIFLQYKHKNKALPSALWGGKDTERSWVRSQPSLHTKPVLYVFLQWIHSDGRVYLCNTVHKLSLQLYVQSWASRERGEQNSLPKYVPLVVKL